MSIDLTQTAAILFDYGNTLVEFGEKQVHYLNGELLKKLTDLYGSCDPQRLKEIRDRQIIRPFHNDYRENDNREICAELVREVYSLEPEDHHLDLIVQTRCDSYLQSVAVDDEVISILTQLRERYRLAIVSNYPISAPVLEGIRLLGLAPLFEVVIISADIGFIKPHPAPFRKALEQLGLNAEECVYVGDNWLADVQGAKRLGMKAIHTTQFTPYERFDPQERDHKPDGTIGHMRELLEILAGT